ncbi:MAG: L-rhamnose isomerase [Phycisphaerae bacterium SM23_30]|nr:MAG: L-rhamnose isomerase [Phycisphaerae bacterium SM23_30]
MDSTCQTEKAYKLAQEHYAVWGVDTEAALKNIYQIPISLPCWQGDDVGGFETPDAKLNGGGIQATGNYPGKARTIAELRADLDKALSLIPGQHRVNLHACYLENDNKFVDRNEITVEYFQSWIDWAKSGGLGLDFNPTFFSHPKADEGFTLSSLDDNIRQFWIEHGIACRRIAAEMGKQLGSPCVCNVWIPDGYKDTPIDRRGPRQRLSQSLDTIFAEKFSREHLLDSVESKLFGIGSESYVVGSHDFYLGYAISRRILLCLDTGHYHPTEQVADKISSVLTYLDEILLHVSRAVRWDSDHVVTLSDELLSLAEELVRGNFLERTHIGLDYFDGSINRIAAWVIGARNMIKALLLAFLQPLEQLRTLESEGDFTARLALLEEYRTLPAGAVWDYYCLKHNVPIGSAWLDEVRAYEKSVLARRIYSDDSQIEI